MINSTKIEIAIQAETWIVNFNCAKQHNFGWFCFSSTIYKMILIILAASAIIINYFILCIYYLNLNDFMSFGLTLWSVDLLADKWAPVLLGH